MSKEITSPQTNNVSDENKLHSDVRYAEPELTNEQIEEYKKKCNANRLITLGRESFTLEEEMEKFKENQTEFDTLYKTTKIIPEVIMNQSFTI
ncbi:MAG: hypothetical protein LBG80_02385 [Bacteroidales bacterium]|jgi:hypothetical protein|nr:hypothetical protein [Bacteroidales bacterium]